jgi:hypothetical protein
MPLRTISFELPSVPRRKRMPSKHWSSSARLLILQNLQKQFETLSSRSILIFYGIDSYKLLLLLKWLNGYFMFISCPAIIITIVSSCALNFLCAVKIIIIIIIIIININNYNNNKSHSMDAFDPSEPIMWQVDAAKGHKRYVSGISEALGEIEIFKEEGQLGNLKLSRKMDHFDKPHCRRKKRKLKSSSNNGNKSNLSSNKNSGFRDNEYGKMNNNNKLGGDDDEGEGSDEGEDEAKLSQANEVCFDYADDIFKGEEEYEEMENANGTPVYVMFDPLVVSKYMYIYCEYFEDILIFLKISMHTFQ